MTFRSFITCFLNAMKKSLTKMDSTESLFFITDDNTRDGHKIHKYPTSSGFSSLVAYPGETNAGREFSQPV